MKLKFKKLDPNAKMPVYAHANDSGMDICAIETKIVPAHGYATFRTGLSAQLPDGFELQVRPRSGLAFKYGVICAFGTVDAGYRGGIGIALFNHGENHLEFKAGERIAQLVLVPVMQADIVETDVLDATERGQGGFGSTGR